MALDRGMFAALIVGFALGTAAGVGTSNDPTASGGSTASGAAAAKPQDFTITIKVTEKKCFGSAGCNVSYQIEPKYVGTGPLPKGKKITVVYEVSGGDAPQVNRFTIQGDTASFDEEEFIQTPRSSSELTATVTDIF